MADWVKAVLFLLPRPALRGERVGVRGSLREHRVRDRHRASPLTQNSLTQISTSPRKRAGRGKRPLLFILAGQSKGLQAGHDSVGATPSRPAARKSSPA